MAYLFTDVDQPCFGLQTITTNPWHPSRADLGEARRTRYPLGAVPLGKPTPSPAVIPARFGVVRVLQAVDRWVATPGALWVLLAMLLLLLASPAAKAQQLTPIANPDAGNGYGGYPILFNNALYGKYTNSSGKDVLAKYDGTSWTTIANPDAGSYSGYSPIVFNNALYGSYATSGKYVLAKYDGTSLTTIANPDAGIGYFGEPILFNQVLYVKYSNASARKVLATFDGMSYTTIANPDAGFGYIGSPIVFNNALCVLYQKADIKLVLGKYDGTSWTLINNPDAGSGYEGNPIVFNNALYGAYKNASDKFVLAKYDGTSLTTIANPDAGLGYVGDPILFNNALYGQYVDASGKNILAKYDGTSWTTMANPDAGPGYQGSPILFNNALYGVYTNASGKNVLAKYDGTSWALIDNPDAGPGYQGSPIVFNNALYGQYTNASGKNVLAILWSPCALTVSATPASQTITSGQSATLTASGATTYTWSNGSTANPLILSNVTTATTLSVTGVTGACSATASATVSVTAAPTPAITAGTATGTITACAGTASVSTQTFTTSGASLTANIVATAPAGFEISTSAGSGFGASLTLMQSGGTVSNTPIYVRSSATATGPISGNVVLTSGGATTQNVAVSGTVNALPVASILPTSTTLTCASPTVSLTASGGSTYRWDDNSTNPVRSVSSSGPYSVTVTSNGCSAVASTSVSQDNTVPTATITGTLTVVSGGTTTLTASGGGSYLWSTGQTVASISATAGPYSLTVTIANGCFATTSATVTTVVPPNTPPTVANPVSPQSATVGAGYTLSLANVFTDAETPNQLTLSVSGLPAGLSFTAPSTISGTPSLSGVSNVTVTATDPGSLSASTSFSITVSPAGGTPPPPSGTFSITGVTTVSCQVLSAGQRRLTFTPQYAGLNGAPVSFSVANEMLPTTNPGPYALDLYTDNPVVTLQAVQSGVSSSFIYNWLSACSSGARVASPQEVPLSVTVLGNPVVGELVTVEVRGAEGQTLRLQLTDERGYQVTEQLVGQASIVERQTVRLGQTPAGLLLLRVSTSTQSLTVKLLKAE
ncbi:putative Ig domain-containing protein [Spirosoma spitsbergense]|uniref:putative Ig domain-containing protein n=1 Tax=Spirosoma spitsbergense TaxID=431554 RepID=UPI00037AC64B|nr:putative Ig domain-containing protein [Spirosoma spitsbergense]